MKKQDISTLSVFSYIGPFWFVGLISERKNDPTLRYHINQGLVLFIFDLLLGAILWALNNPISSIPIVGNMLLTVLCALTAIFCAGLSVKGAIGAVRGKTASLPIIGSITIISGGRVKR